MNLLRQIELTVNGGPDPPPWLIRPLSHPRARFDLSLIAPGAAARDAGALEAAGEALSAAGLISAARVVRGGHLQVRLAERAVAERAERLAAGGLEPMGELARGRTYVVHFCDPNATKALHVGHLRNIAVGRALSAALRRAGATVRTRSVVADFGRNMAEALAAIWPEREVLSRWERSGQKCDHLIGRRYTAYVGGAGRGPEVGAADEPLAREVRDRDDLPNALLRRMLAGDAETTVAWHRLRELAVRGQLETLAALGVEFDELEFESRFAEPARRLALRAGEEGAASREAGGRIACGGPGEDAPVLSLLRGDGVPTQHMLKLAYWRWYAFESGFGGARAVRVLGDEWKPAGGVLRELWSRLDGATPYPVRYVFHGMVTMDGEEVKSSRRNAPLIDELLDRLEADARSPSGRRGGPTGPGLPPRAVAANALLGYFMTRAPGPRIDLSLGKLGPEGGSFGWLHAAALAAARRRAPAAVDPHAEADLRFAVVRADLVRTHLEHAVRALDTTRLAAHLHHLAGWYLERPRGAAVSAVARATLEGGGDALGLRSAPA